MKFTETKLQGAFIVELKTIGDDRGFFARTFCAKEFEEHGLNPNVVQCNLSFNVHKGTLRGMHYQLAPAMENKFVRCTRGALVDVIVDIREGSPTYLQHVGVELTADNRRALYVPEGFAHGFQTLVDDTEACYQVSEFYTPEQERGLRYNDPKLALDWPLPVATISEKDDSWPYLG